LEFKLTGLDWVTLTIPFKGDRPYLQSANVWDAVCDFILSDDFTGTKEFQKEDVMLDIVFKRLIHSKVELYLSESRPLADKNMVAQIILTTKGKKRLFGLLRSTGLEETERLVDMENSFRQDVKINKTGSIYKKNIQLSLSQIFVAMVKFWHQDVVDKDCKWLATRLQLPLLYHKAKPKLILTNTSIILKDGLGSITDVGVDSVNDLAGRIYFYKT